MDITVLFCNFLELLLTLGVTDVQNWRRKKHEKKIRKVEYGTFSPLSTGRTGPLATVVYKQIATQLPKKNSQQVSLLVKVHTEFFTTPFCCHLYVLKAELMLLNLNDFMLKKLKIVNTAKCICLVKIAHTD